MAKLGPQCCFLDFFFLTDNAVYLSHILTFYFYTSIDQASVTSDNLINAIRWFGLRGAEVNNTRESLDETTGQIVHRTDCTYR